MIKQFESETINNKHDIKSIQHFDKFQAAISIGRVEIIKKIKTYPCLVRKNWRHKALQNITNKWVYAINQEQVTYMR